MSGYCLPTVFDAQPTLAHYWVTVSCLKPRWMWTSVTDGGPTLTQLWFKASWKASWPYRCWYSVGPQSAALDRRCTGVGWTYILFCCDDDGGLCSVDSTHWPSVDLVTDRRRGRWTGIESALGLFLLFAGCDERAARALREITVDTLVSTLTRRGRH